MSTYYKQKWARILSSSCALIIVPSIIHLVVGGMTIGDYDSDGVNKDTNAYNIIMLFATGIAHFAGSAVALGYITFHTNEYGHINEELYEKFAAIFVYLFYAVPLASVIYGTSIYRSSLDACYDQRRLYMYVFIVKVVMLIISSGILIPEIVHRIKEDIHCSRDEVQNQGVQNRNANVVIPSPNNIVIRNTYVSNTQMIQIHPRIVIDDVKIDMKNDQVDKKLEEEEDKINYALSLSNKNIDTCVICYKLRWMMVFSPCGHAKCCQRCSITLSNNENFRCPICRSNVESYTKLYL